MFRFGLFAVGIVLFLMGLSLAPAAHDLSAMGASEYNSSHDCPADESDPVLDDCHAAVQCQLCMTLASNVELGKVQSSEAWETLVFGNPSASSLSIALPPPRYFLT